MTFKNNDLNLRAAGWLMLLTVLTGASASACSDDESSQGDAMTDDDAADDDSADDDAADDDTADDDVADDDSADDDAADDDAADDDAADDDAADDDAADDDAADDDAADDDAADDDVADDDAADDDATDDDAADDDAGADDDSTDAGADDDSDAGEPPGNAWADCPASDTWVADSSWPLTLAVSSDAVYCATFNESRTLQEEFASKAQLRFTPGSYALPEGAEVPSSLPLCIRDAAGAITTLTSGTVRTELTPMGESTRYALNLSGVLNDAAESSLQANVAHTAGTDADPAFALDGKEPAFDGDAYQEFLVCQDVDNCFPMQLFTSCGYESGTPNLHRVQLETGDLEFELRLGDSFAGTEPGAYVRASGSFLGQEFTQTDYFKLVYHPTHHHFERTFVVLFDSPIDGACGVEVTNLEPFGDDVPDEAYTVDCDLERLEAVTVSSAELVLE